MSDVLARWGKPIDVEAFAQDSIAKDAASSLELDSRPLVKALSAEIEKRLKDITINAPDWYVRSVHMHLRGTELR